MKRKKPEVHTIEGYTHTVYLVIFEDDKRKRIGFTLVHMDCICPGWKKRFLLLFLFSLFLLLFMSLIELFSTTNELLNPRFLIQLSETLLVKLTRIHYY